MERRELLTGLAFVGAASVAGPVADELNNSYWAPAVVKKGLDFLQTRRLLAQDLRPFEPSKEFILADVVSEPFKFFSAGRGLSELLHEFADAHLERMAADGKVETIDPHQWVENYASIFRKGLRADQGICNGVSNYMALKRGTIPEVGYLGNHTFDNTNLHEISGLGGVLHTGDAQVQEVEFPGDLSQAGFLQFMINKYLRQGEEFVMNTARSLTFCLPIDGYRVNSILSASNYPDGFRVDLTLRGPDYTDPGFTHATVDGYRRLNIIYEVDSVDNPTQGRYLSHPGIVSLDLWRPNPARFLLVDARTGRFVGDQALEDWSRLPGILEYRVQGAVFSKSMIESFNILAAPATSLTCLPQEIYCK